MYKRNLWEGVGMRNPFNSDCKTKKEVLKILREAHLKLVNLDPAVIPEEVYGKKCEYEKILLKYIWKFSKEVFGKGLI